MQNSKKCPPNLITFFEDMLNLVFQMGKSEMERKGNFAPSYLSFPVPFRPFQINPAFLSLSEKNGQLSGKGNIAFLSLTCMPIVQRKCKPLPKEVFLKKRGCILIANIAHSCTYFLERDTSSQKGQNDDKTVMFPLRTSLYRP